MMGEREVPARLVEGVDAAPVGGTVLVGTGSLGRGFVAPDLQAGGAHRDRPHRSGRPGHEGHAAHAVAATQRRRPAAGSSPATTSCTSSTASAGSSRWCSAPCRAPPASTW
nr:hypothetical protein [Angustibacter aerolatus]